MSALKRFDDLKITLEAIKSATDNFSCDSFIGHGGFGKVYKGELVNSKGRIMAAFKRLDRSFGQGNPEFWKEIVLLSRYKHKNVVSLLGFCDEDGEKILMYEYASNNSLEKHLESSDLTWINRLKICSGAARGLAYLHDPDDTQQRVLHRDIKSGNILLDESWNAKISDFGLSKIGPANQENTFVISSVVGTLGYCDPQYMATGLVTKATDVYSFGVVLFEVLCGRLCTSNDKNLDLARLARTSYEQNRMMEIVYKHIKDQIGPDSLKFFTEIAYQCLKIDDQQRPLMPEVVKALERALDSTVSCNDIEMITGAFLNIGPPQLNFLFELGKMMECSMHLQNTTDHHIAYQVQGWKENIYLTRQINGIVLPCSTKILFVEISGHKQAPRGMRCNDVVTILTAVASPGAKPEDMIEMFNEESENKVEICTLKINLIYPSPLF
ncbi:putative receptor-like protein kinase [Tanacetum coccineum]